MEVMWAADEASVRDVVEKLDRKLAYTTVMTTLDRLFKKGVPGSPEIGAGLPLHPPRVPPGLGTPARR